MTTVEQLEAEREALRAKLKGLTREIVRARARAEAERRKLNGLCVDCGVPCAPDGRCGGCNERHTDRARMRARALSDARPTPRRACGCKGHGAHRMECPHRARRAA